MNPDTVSPIESEIMTEKSNAESGLDQEKSTTITEAPASERSARAELSELLDTLGRMPPSYGRRAYKEAARARIEQLFDEAWRRTRE